MLRKHKEHKKNLGLTFIEVAVAMAISAVIIAASLSYFSATKDARAHAQTIGMVRTMLLSLQVTYANNPYSLYSGFNTLTPVIDGMFEGKYLDADGKTWVFPGDIDLLGATTASPGGVNYRALLFRFHTANACNDFVKSDFPRPFYIRAIWSGATTASYDPVGMLYSLPSGTQTNIVDSNNVVITKTAVMACAKNEQSIAIVMLDVIDPPKP